MDRDKKIKVVNKFNGIVGYSVPELGVNRTFYPKETKYISFDELEKLTYLPGGESILKENLEIMDEEALMELFNVAPEPEYHYTEEDVKTLMTSGSLDQFLDCLDFAPEVIIDMIKNLAVELPLNDMAKRDAIREKTGFDVTRAIEIKNTKYDAADENTSAEEPVTTSKRRAAPLKSETKAAAPTGRRYQPNK